MTDWLTSPYYTPPAAEPEFYMDGAFPAVTFSVDYAMGLAIDSDMKNPNYFFSNNPTLDAMYHDPMAYAKNLVAYADTLVGNKEYRKPEGWNPAKAGIQYATIAFGILKLIPCNRGDDTSNNLYDSWAAGTGQNYGGHATPVPEAPIA